MSTDTTLQRVRLAKVNAICQAPQCRKPAAYRLDFDGSRTAGVDDLLLCVHHARETCERYGYAWH